MKCMPTNIIIIHRSIRALLQKNNKLLLLLALLFGLGVFLCIIIIINILTIINEIIKQEQSLSWINCSFQTSIYHVHLQQKSNIFNKQGRFFLLRAINRNQFSTIFRPFLNLRHSTKKSAGKKHVKKSPRQIPHQQAISSTQYETTR